MGGGHITQQQGAVCSICTNMYRRVQILQASWLRIHHVCNTVYVQACNDTSVGSTNNAYGVSGRVLEWQLSDSGTDVSRANGVTTVTHELSPIRLVMDRSNALCVVVADAQSVPLITGAHLLKKASGSSDAAPSSVSTRRQQSVT